ncbi:SLBB domain-containing protein [Flavihumibacter sp. ZG627]|uniref:SLBB domain-containing protein n=1 Tax=Flavihumibacter sp. ZG627 TaxID=1463156 RepID=UPI00069470F3|nr:SLBB domain-containing protein [Flavihumibacter sp. ZG627]
MDFKHFLLVFVPLQFFFISPADGQSRNFGAEVFANPNATFEPNMRIATPVNYQLGPEDELLIDISGYSEASYKLKVSPEGSVRIPGVGAIQVNGLTMEQARRVITKKLSSTIYTNIRSGLTTVDISLGNIRSIKVTIIGEATRPGTYTLPSLATVYNALYACSGPGTNGSYRDVELIRNNTRIAVVDIYEYLANGQKKNDIRLMDQDVIKINTYKVRVELRGEIKKPGLYDVKEGESLAHILDYAGGFTDSAYTARIQVYSNTTKEKKIGTIEGDKVAQTIPRRGDSYLIGKILNRYANRISINGAVYRPGAYELKEGMTINMLVNEAEGLRDDAFSSRVIIHRLMEDLRPQIIAVDLGKIRSNEIADIPLMKEDRVHVYSTLDLKEGQYVKIGGEVSKPGDYTFEEGMSLQDLVLLAGGLREGAATEKVEISRRVRNAEPNGLETVTAEIYEELITLNMRSNGDSSSANFLLKPFDEISVRPAPGYFIQKNAVVEGEVVYTGKYTLKTKNDRISDLVKRAGGLTPEAYQKGAVLVRTKNLSKTEIDNSEQGITNLMKQNIASGTPEAILQNQIASIIFKRSENVGIDLEKIMKEPGSEYDLLLNDGDTLRIPKLLQTVRVNGEVLYPTLVRYNDKFRFRDYISGAGGFTERSARKKAYSVYANGSASSTKSFFFIRKYPRVSAGADIFVPTRRERERLRPIEAVTIGTALVTMLAILLNVVK